MKYQPMSFVLFLALLACNTTSKLSKPGEPIFVAPLAVQAYSFRNYFPKDVVATLDNIKAMGITEIEGTPGRIDLEDYKKTLRRKGH